MVKYEISQVNNDVKLGLQLKAERCTYVICASHFSTAQPCFFPDTMV